MSRPHVSIVVGTRPEAIKMAPLYLALKTEPSLRVSLLATAQHRQMLDQVLAVFGIRPDIDLDLMCPDQSLTDISARILCGVQAALAELKPQAVMVHGDTSTCLFSAIASFYERIPVGHVEAGIRTGDLNAPWPEEMNRRLVDPLCCWCFAPTTLASDNLRREGVDEAKIFITGNTVIDALLLSRRRAWEQHGNIGGFSECALNSKRMILVTGHRRESFGKPFEQFCLALRDIVRAHEDVVLVYPVHMNPNVKLPVHQILGGDDRVHLIEPVEYLSFLWLMDNSYFIITDSGGIQEEAPTLGKPVLVTRGATERPEAMQAGLAKLVGTSRQTIVAEANKLLTDREAYARMASGDNPYGDGQASLRIVDILRTAMVG
jgi:UDP-N-acetylglucosamine 2-epimerase (non-hydrolysing)